MKIYGEIYCQRIYDNETFNVLLYGWKRRENDGEKQTR